MAYEPDLPPLPDDGFQAGTRLLLEMYANELVTHAASITRIDGLSPYAVSMYKNNVFEAARLLKSSAQMLRDNGFGKGPPPSRETLLARLGKMVGILGVALCFVAGATLAAVVF